MVGNEEYSVHIQENEGSDTEIENEASETRDRLEEALESTPKLQSSFPFLARAPVSPSDIEMMAAAAVNQVLDEEKARNEEKTRNKRKSKPSKSIKQEKVVKQEMPPDQSQLMSLYSNQDYDNQDSNELDDSTSIGTNSSPKPSKKVHQCEYCQKKLKSQTALAYHKKHVHQVLEDDSVSSGGPGMLGVIGSYTPEVIKCDQCNKKFKSAQGLKYHMMHHTGRVVLLLLLLLLLPTPFPQIYVLTM